MSDYKRTTLDAFKRDPSQDVMVPKGIVSDLKEIDSVESRVLEGVISTPAVDRDNDTIAIDGWELEEFRSNPVVLFGHDSSQPPVGKSLSVWKEGQALKSRFQMTSEDENPFGSMIFNMIKSGFLKATSVGFVPTIFQFNEERGGFAVDFLQQKLLEFSVVPIPSNPEALIASGMKGLDLLTGWATKALDGEFGDLIIPRHCVETTHKLLTGNATTVTIRNDTPDLAVVEPGGEDGDASSPVLADETNETNETNEQAPEANVASSVAALIETFGADAVRSELGIEAEPEIEDDEGEDIFEVDLDEVSALVGDAINQARAHAAGELT